MEIKKAREDLRKGKTIYDMNLKVAYYGRVSTDKDDQLNSLENQQHYFEDMIKENSNWIFTRGYIDEGISGTAVKNRDSFLKMIEDATLGKIDLILTKEISRFSRNTVDSIKYTEYLLKQGVIVYFLSDNLNTIQEDAEFRLTIMSSMAQDEVRKLSERVKFGINRMIKDRKLIGGNLTGYYKKNGIYEINPNEAPLIKYLFTTYASGSLGLKKIGEELAQMGYLNSKGKPYSQTALAKMLSNPRYKGFYTAKLTEVEDYKTHKKKKIPKEEQIIEKDDRIPAIVSEELWDKANALHERRKKLPSRHVLNSEEHIKKYKYSAKLYCKDCNSIFIRNGGSNRSLNPTWACKTYKTEGVSKCESPIIKESYLDKIFVDLFSDFIKHKKDYLGQVLSEYKNIVKNFTDELDTEEIKRKIEQIDKQKDKLLDLSLKGMIDDFEFKKRNDKFNTELFNLQKQIDSSESQNLEEEKMRKKLNDIESCLSAKLDIKENLPYLVNLLVDKVIVEKVNGDRKHIKLSIYFDFNTPDIDIDLDMNTKNELKSRSLQTLACRRQTPVLKCSCIDTKQSWSKYRNTFEFEETLANSIKYSAKIDVCSTYNLIYDGVEYSSNERIEFDNNMKQSFNEIKIQEDSKNNIDTNTYENLIFNKKKIAISLFDKLDKEILSINNEIKRNYLIKNVAYKFINKILEIQINQNNLLVTFHRDSKQFDNYNKLGLKKGYENTSLCYCMIVESNEDILYVKKLVQNLYDYINSPKEDIGAKLLDILSFKIKTLSEDITTHKTNKGLVFRNKRNFAILCKTNYGIYIRILNVNNQENILHIVTRKSYEPLCLSYKILNTEDIEKIFPYIIESYRINEINPIDLKNKFYELYYSE